MAYITIHTPGVLTTIQDHGRYGFQRFGMPVAGAADQFSMTIANILAGNPLDSAGLEATWTGPEIGFSSSGAIAVCGADMGPCINGNPIPLYTATEIKKGDRLTFSGLKTGCRAYIAFAGGIAVPRVMNSRSTYLRAKVGGLEGRALKPGDHIPLGPIPHKIRKIKIPLDLIPSYLPSQAIRILPGPEVNRFSPEGIHTFLNSEYRVTEHSDRMGYRLAGPVIGHLETGADIISAGVSAGTVQVPGNGQPIILMADRQTTGGYTRLANVVSVDLSLVAQLKPGDCIRFKEISLEKAQQLVILRNKGLLKLLNS